MKHANDISRTKYNKSLKRLLLYCIAVLASVGLFCIILLVGCNLIFSRSEPLKDTKLGFSHLAQVDSQVFVNEEQKGKLSTSGVLSAPVAFGRLSGVLDGLNSLATLFLKIACIFFLIEAAKFFMNYKEVKDRLSWRDKEELKKRGNESTEPFPTDSFDMKEGPRYICHVWAAQSTGLDDKQEVADPMIKQGSDIPDAQDIDLNGSEVQPLEIEQDMEKCQQEKFIWFDFKDEFRALNFMKGDYSQGPLYFIKLSSGALEGIKIGLGRYQISPKMEEITEAELNYSSITACFEIVKGIGFGKKFRIRVEQPAILVEKEEELYIIETKGKLTVTDTIE